MVSVPAQKKTLSPEMRARLTEALEKKHRADAALWDLCREAVQPNEGTFEQVADLLGIAKSTLQNKLSHGGRS